jgi:hypothetical protein
MTEQNDRQRWKDLRSTRRILIVGAIVVSGIATYPAKNFTGARLGYEQTIIDILSLVPVLIWLGVLVVGLKERGLRKKLEAESAAHTTET